MPVTEKDVTNLSNIMKLRLEWELINGLAVKSTIDYLNGFKQTEFQTALASHMIAFWNRLYPKLKDRSEPDFPSNYNNNDLSKEFEYFSKYSADPHKLIYPSKDKDGKDIAPTEGDFHKLYLTLSFALEALKITSLDIDSVPYMEQLRAEWDELYVLSVDNINNYIISPKQIKNQNEFVARLVNFWAILYPKLRNRTDLINPLDGKDYGTSFKEFERYYFDSRLLIHGVKDKDGKEIPVVKGDTQRLYNTISFALEALKITSTS